VNLLVTDAGRGSGFGFRDGAIPDKSAFFHALIASLGFAIGVVAFSVAPKCVEVRHTSSLEVLRLAYTVKWISPFVFCSVWATSPVDVERACARCLIRPRATSGWFSVWCEMESGAPPIS
jgi:hypothetical protein